MADITNGIDRCWNEAHSLLKRPDIGIDEKRRAMEVAHDCICGHIQLLLSSFGNSVANLPGELQDYISDLIQQAGCSSETGT